MSREELLISLLKLKESIAELCRSKNNNVEIEETKKNFNELRDRFSKEKMKRIRKKISFQGRDWQVLKRTRKKKPKKQFNGTRKTREKTLHQKIKKG